MGAEDLEYVLSHNSQGCVGPIYILLVELTIDSKHIYVTQAIASSIQHV